MSNVTLTWESTQDTHTVKQRQSVHTFRTRVTPWSIWEAKGHSVLRHAFLCISKNSNEAWITDKLHVISCYKVSSRSWSNDSSIDWRRRTWASRGWSVSTLLLSSVLQGKWIFEESISVRIRRTHQKERRRSRHEKMSRAQWQQMVKEWLFWKKEKKDRKLQNDIKWLFVLEEEEYLFDDEKRRRKQGRKRPFFVSDFPSLLFSCRRRRQNKKMNLCFFMLLFLDDVFYLHLLQPQKDVLIIREGRGENWWPSSSPLSHVYVVFFLKRVFSTSLSFESLTSWGDSRSMFCHVCVTNSETKREEDIDILPWQEGRESVHEPFFRHEEDETPESLNPSGHEKRAWEDTRLWFVIEISRLGSSVSRSGQDTAAGISRQKNKTGWWWDVFENNDRISQKEEED